MKLREIKDVLELKVETKREIPEVEVEKGYVSDLLSDVMGHAEEGSIWITIQTHPNIVGVAVLKDIPAVIITGGRSPQEDTLKKADEEGIVIFSTSKNSFEVAGILYAKGIR